MAGQSFKILPSGKVPEIATDDWLTWHEAGFTLAETGYPDNLMVPQADICRMVCAVNFYDSTIWFSRIGATTYTAMHDASQAQFKRYIIDPLSREWWQLWIGLRCIEMRAQCTATA